MPTDSHHSCLPVHTRSLATLRPGDVTYPVRAAQWREWVDRDGLFRGPESPPGPVLACIGDPGLVDRPSLGLLCSVKCPGTLVLETYEFARKASRDGPTIIGGFHSPMERTCLDTLLARHIPTVCCPARRLNIRGIPLAWDEPIADRRLLVLSPFAESQRRVTRDLARHRNMFVAALCEELFVPFAAPWGTTEAVVRWSLASGKRVYTLAGEEGAHLVRLGAEGVSVGQLLQVGARLNGGGGDLHAG